MITIPYLRVCLGHVREDVQRRAHHGRVLVAQGAPELVAHVPYAVRLQLQEPVQQHDRLLSNDLLIVLQQVGDDG